MFTVEISLSFSIILCGLKTGQTYWVNVTHLDGEERYLDSEEVSVTREEVSVAHLDGKEMHPDGEEVSVTREEVNVAHSKPICRPSGRGTC
jgi:hypothetical protein